MRIAILSPVAWRTPPRHYGPWEQVASNIAEGLTDRGFDVTLFATGDSVTKGKLEAVIPKGYEETQPVDAKVCECLHISHLMEKAHDFDLIHNNFDFLPLTYSGLIKTPMVTTIHGFSSPLIVPVYKKYNRSNHYVSISNADRSPELEYIATVYNGLQTSQFSFNEKPDDYLLYFGRIHHDKGCAEAIDIAVKAGKKLIIAGLIQDKKYYEEKVQPFIDNESVIYVGNADAVQRNELLGKAYALLHPIHFKEPFGLSVAEAMLCGTPVIAFNKGSMPELIQHNKTGFLVNNVDEAVDSIKLLVHIKRENCREWAMANFSCDKMVEDYIKVYDQIL